MVRSRWLLHPLVTALGLLVVGALTSLRALTAPAGSTAAVCAMLVTVAVAGAAAGFANSGST